MTIESEKCAERTPRQHGAMEYSHAPVDLDTVRQDRLSGLRSSMAKHNVAGLLLFDQINTRYATDATNMQVWCSHYETRCVFIAQNGPVVLFDYANHPHLADGLPGIDEYRVIPSFYFFSAGPNGPDRVKIFADQIDDLMKTHCGDDQVLGVDRLSFPACDALRERGLILVEGEGVCERARSIKSAGELELMRASMAVCEAGCLSMKAALEPGITENALWAKLHETNIRLGGEWIETRLLSSGPRTNPWFRECSMRPIEKGDMVSFDTALVGPYGYCCDMSRSWICDAEPDDEQKRLYAAAYEQIKRNMELLKPGLGYRELTEKLHPMADEFIAGRYGVAMHGVGLCDEAPAIYYPQDYDAVGYDGVFEEGMVVCVEALIGTEGGKECVKLEEQVLITADGHEQLTSYPLEEHWV